jgi:hypothetical protein
MKINWQNVIENAVLTILIVVAVNIVMIRPMERQLEAKDKTIVELSKIAKYAITNDFGKTKAKDGTVNLNLDNAMEVENNEATQTNVAMDTITPEVKKKPFWKFWKRE